LPAMEGRVERKKKKGRQGLQRLLWGKRKREEKGGLATVKVRFIGGAKLAGGVEKGVPEQEVLTWEAKKNAGDGNNI